MAGKDELILFMEDYTGTPTAVPLSKAEVFQKAQDELRRRDAAGEDVDKLDPETLAGIQELIRTCMEKRSDSSKDMMNSV